MATPDYARRTTQVKAVEKENTAAWKTGGTLMDDGVKRALAIRDEIAWGRDEYDRLCNLVADGMESWYALADRIVPLQKEQKDAVKAKDKAKVKELEKQIAALDGKAAAVEKDVQKSLKAANSLKDDLIAAIRAMDKVAI